MILDHVRFAYGVDQGTDFIPSLPPTPYLRSLGPAIGGDIDGDSGIRASYIIYQLELLSFAIRYMETEWPDLVAFLETVQDGQEFLFFPIDGDDDVSFWVTLESPLPGGSYAGVPDSQYPRALSLAIVLAGVASFDTLVPLPVPIGHDIIPTPPTVIAAEVLSDTAIKITWIIPAADVSVYRVQHNDGSGWIETVVGSDITELTFTGLAEGSTHSFRVFVERDGLLSVASNIVTPTTYLTVHDLDISSAQIDDVHLSWTDLGTEIGYQLQRSTDGGAFVDIGPELAAGTTTTIDATADNLHTYTYRLAIISPASVRYVSNTVDITFDEVATDLTMTVLSDSSVRADWAAVAGAAGYRVGSRIGAGAWVEADVSAATLQATFLGLNEGETRDYRVRVIDGAGILSPSSNVVTSTTLLKAPNDLAFTSRQIDDVHLAWTDRSGLEAGYQVQRRVDGGAWADLGAQLAAGTQVYVDATADNLHDYDYRVAVVSGAGVRNLSNVVSVTFNEVATVLSVTALSNSVLRASWTAVAGAVTYRVGYRTGAGAWTDVDVASPTLLYDLTGLAEGSARQFRVFVIDANGILSPVSNLVTATTLLTAPVDFAISLNEVGNMQFTWTDLSGLEAGYQLQRSDNGAGFVDLGAQLAAGTQAATDATALGGHAYLYRVAVVASSGVRNYSNVVSTSIFLWKSGSGLLFRDSFTRANAANLGADWTNIQGAFALTGNEAVSTGGSDNDRTAATAMANRAGQCVQAKVKTNANPSGSQPAILGRWASAGAGSFYLLDISRSDLAMRMFRFSGGAFTSLGTSAGVPAANTYTTIKLAIEASSQKGYRIGTAQVITAADATLNAVDGRAGIRVGSSAGTSVATWDDFIVCASNKITINGLATGQKIKIGGKTSAAAIGGTALVFDMVELEFPQATLDVTGTDGVTVIRSVTPSTGIYGGDTFDFSGSTGIAVGTSAGVYDGVTVGITAGTRTVFCPDGLAVLTRNPTVGTLFDTAGNSVTYASGSANTDPAITVTFDSAVTSVTASAVDVSRAGSRLIAYDSTGTELGRIDFTVTGLADSTPSTKTLTFAGIRSIQLVSGLEDIVGFFGISFTH